MNMFMYMYVHTYIQLHTYIHSGDAMGFVSFSFLTMARGGAQLLLLQVGLAMPVSPKPQANLKKRQY